MRNLFGNTFSSLKSYNFRLYFIGQAISASGTFMQSVAQAWLVLKLTGSGTALGIITALQFLPMIIFGPWGGVLADRFDKRKILLITQTVFAVQAIILGMLVITGVVRVWMVGVLALMFGFVNVIDNPVRQAFVPEMVGIERLRNAASLYASLINLTRAVGPMIGAYLIATVGIGLCFMVNGISYIAIIAILIAMKGGELIKSEKTKAIKGKMREGVQYIMSTPTLFYTLLMMAIIGTFTYEFQVSLPLLAQYTLRGDAGTLALLMSVQGAGSIIGGVLFAGQKKSSIDMLVSFALFFGISTLLASIVPGLTMISVFIFISGFFSVLFLSLGNTILQLESTPIMHGRVMAYWSMAFLGSTAIGGPIIGWIGEHLSPQWSLAAGGVAAIIAAVTGHLAISKIKAKATDSILGRAELVADEQQRLR